MDINQVVDNNCNRLMAIPGVVGIGVGVRDGNPVIVIMVLQVTSELESLLPQTLEGCTVVVEETGEVTAF